MSNFAPVESGGMKSQERMIIRLAFGIALTTSLFEFGFDQPPLPRWLLITLQLMAVAVYVLVRTRQALRTSTVRQVMNRHWFDGLILLIIGAIFTGTATLFSTPGQKLSILYLTVIQVAIVIRLFIEAIRWNLSLSQKKIHPARMLMASFSSLIVAGGVFLSLPRCTSLALRSAEDFSWIEHIINCFFTSVSAVCVTGLTVYDTGNDFTVWGQLVILILIQLGGLGIMLFGSAVGLIVGQNFSLKQSLVLQDITSHRMLSQMRGMVVFILLVTFASEAMGAVLLYSMWQDITSPWERIYYSIFHSVSAFCNAGFSLHSDSLMSYRLAWPVYTAILPLIVLGGIGFPVLYDCAAVISTKFERWRNPRVHFCLEDSNPRVFLSLHTKLVLGMTAILIVLPVFVFFLLETFSHPSTDYAVAVEQSGVVRTDRIMDGTIWRRLLDSFFLTVTTRTAGFNTMPLDIQSVSSGTLFFSAILMFIGGSPASIAGGVKTVAVAVVVLGVWTTIRGKEQVEIFARRIPDDVVRRASVIVFIMFLMASTFTLLICLFEHVPVIVALFETVSALGTVGLSTGLTPELSFAGKLTIMVAMFAGRIGPLSLMIAITGQSGTARYSYPEQGVSLG